MYLNNCTKEISHRIATNTSYLLALTAVYHFSKEYHFLHGTSELRTSARTITAYMGAMFSFHRLVEIPETVLTQNGQQIAGNM